MKKWMKIAGMLMFPVAVQAQYNYVTNYDNTITITRYTGSGGAVTVPNTIDSLPVTVIGDGAFSDCYGLTGITIPNSVTRIGSQAFDWCFSLTNIIIPSSVTSIGYDAFSRCGLNSITVNTNNPVFSSLNGDLFNKNQTVLVRHPSGSRSYTIPSSVTNIGYGAFSHCGLTNILIPNSVTRIEGSAFYMCTSLTNLVIPNSVTEIGSGVFGRCENLVSVTIPGSVTNIGDHAFWSCTSLTTVVILDGVTSIGDGAFMDCSSLASVMIPGSVTSIGYSAFINCSSLTEAYFKGSAPAGSDVFYGANNVIIYHFPGSSWGQTFGGRPTVLWPGFEITYSNTNGMIIVTGYTGPGGAVTIPDTIDSLPITVIGDAAFYGCYLLTGVTIPNSVTNIENRAFDSCGRLSNVIIPNSVTRIGAMAFDFCGGLTNLVIPSSVTSIGYDAFTRSGLLSIVVDTNNPVFSSLDGDLFNKNQTVLVRHPNRNAGNYTIPSSVTNIGYGAFSHCTRLTSITIPNSVTRIEGSAFYMCNGLTNIVIPSSITEIGSMMFGYCQNLNSITIPGSVTSISDHAFWLCTNLTEVYLLGNAPSVGSDIFYGADNATIYYLPGTTGWTNTFGGRPTALWKPQIQTAEVGFGVKTNGFGFGINWASDMTVVIDACTNLAEGVWVPVETNTLTGGSVQFRDPAFTNYPSRYYRVSMPQ